MLIGWVVLLGFVALGAAVNVFGRPERYRKTSRGRELILVHLGPIKIWRRMREKERGLLRHLMKPS